MSSSHKSIRFDRYAELFTNPQGPGDGRPTALQIVKDEKMEGQLKGKVILITGASSGVGIETARALAHTGAHLVLAVRDLEKMKAVIDEFLAKDKEFQASHFEMIHMDMNSLASVRKGAEQFLSKHDQLNILINNAGIGGVSQSRTEDGFESHFGVNHMSHFLLFQLVAPVLEKSATSDFKSRVIAVSSAIHRFGSVDFDNYTHSPTANYRPELAYASSKTANIWFANEVDRRYGKRGIHAMSLHPGGINTGLQRFHAPEFNAMMEQLLKDPDLQKIYLTIEQGAATTVLAAIGRDFEGKGGIYLDNCAVIGEFDPEGPVYGPGYVSHTFDEDGAKKLWEESLKFAGL